MSEIFINYRRDDSRGHAGRLYDRLEKKFGKDKIFMDIDHIEPGKKFPEVIQENLNSMYVAIILIGKQWLNITDATGQRRLDDPEDWVRLEIEEILSRHVLAIPVLVDGAAMPAPLHLPSSIISLAKHNAFEISDIRFHYDVDNLIKKLEKELSYQAPPTTSLFHTIPQEIKDRNQNEEINQVTKTILEEQKTTNKSLEQNFGEISLEHENINEKSNQFPSRSAEQHTEIITAINGLKASLPDPKGNELNKLITIQLDRARDFIRDIRANDALELLVSLEATISNCDNYTRFRWHTNIGACYLLLDQREEAAEQYLTAYNFAKDEEKAVANKIRAHLLINQFDYGLKESEKALRNYPDSGIVWAMYIKVKQLLNEEFDLSLLPVALQNDSTILLMLADLKLVEKDFEDSFNLTRKAFDLDNSSIDVKRAMLISAISWATADEVKSYFRQIRSEQYDALKYAVNSFNDIRAFLGSIQSKPVFIEVAHNLTVAIELLGNQEQKKDITAYAFSSYPDEHAFIKYKIKEFEELGDIDSIRELTDNFLNDLEKPVLYLLAEISANKGNLEWNEKILKKINAGILEKRELDELFGLRICALWRSGNKLDAIKLARDNLAQIKASPALLSFYIRMIDEHGDSNERDKMLLLCSNLPENFSSDDIVQFADLFYDFGKYFEAANFYSRLIELPADDYLTKRYLDSLIKSDQRAKALVVLERISNEIREQLPFRRFEAILARASGDLDKLENILEQELKLLPSDSGVALDYISTLYRKNKTKELYDYLAQNPTFGHIIEANEIEIAKYQIVQGLEYEAMLRMYTLFRSNPNSSEIAGYYFLLLIQTKKSDVFKSLRKVEPGTAVYLESDRYNKVVVIEPRHLSEGGGWPECINEESKIAKRLSSHCVGDFVEIEIGIEIHKAKITNIKSMFIFAFDYAHKVIADSASSVGPVWSMNLQKLDGEFDFNPILKSLKSRRQHVERVFNVCDEKKFPLQIIADAIGVDIVTLLLEWPFKHFDLFVSTGVSEELENCKKVIEKGEKSYVIDITGLIELNRLGLLPEILEIIGRPLVSASLKEQLLGLIHVQKNTNPDGFASEINGRIQYQEIPEQYLDERKSFLDKLLRFIDDYCEVSPVMGPDVIGEQLAFIDELIGYPLKDAIYLSLERQAVLISEDGAFNSLAKSIGVTTSTCIQPLLMVLRERKIITEDEYSRCILDKLNRRHDFTSVTANDLLWAAKLCPKTVSPGIESAFQTFRKSTLDWVSGLRVGSLFLKLAAKYITPDVLYRYYQLLLDCLSSGREDSSYIIKESLRVYLVNSLSEIQDKKAKLIIKKFGSILVPQPFPLKIKPIVLAIKKAFPY
ncbi:toll/interleukin-1 receptor domain-containing protein [Nitrosomonas sp. Nm132]|uniref:toll/interleukin-1 receptor domain-containing protein n=1 Tax=Nitrosomonas sp. Nm132 TaxID=1881053 RepID=UPI00088A7F9B|nr:toll/interleukin-1 receptor domain-containing protein [Nitrosomonas sp. Nm132]SDH96967.1 TIR domain-containing protein [Nitrosomonas sp. Nm132]